MDTNRYRHLLAAFNEQTSKLDARAGRLTNKWLESLDHLASSSQQRSRLADHLSRVGRSVTAIQILAEERTSTAPSVSGREALDGATADLKAEIDRLLKQLRRIDQVVEDRGLEMLVGESLSSVEFVVDYVQLRFNGSCLTAFVCPRVFGPGQTLSKADPGYRDALCALIGADVVSTEVREEEFLRVAFKDGRAITVSLHSNDAVGPERAYFTSESGVWWTW